MAQQTARHQGLVSNRESIFIIRDADYDPDVTPSGAIEDSSGQIAGSNGRLIVVRTTSAVVKVGVEVQAWDAQPEQDDTVWEAHREMPLRSHTGAINVEQLYEGPPAGLANIALSSGPGDYTVQICMRGRAELDRGHAAVQSSGGGLSFEQRWEQMRQLDGVEAYRVRIWPTA